MPASSRVEQYFSSVASGYQEASDNRVWGSLRRREAAALMGLMGDVRGLDVLELGCGAGFYTRELLAHGAKTVYAVDLSASMLDQLPKQQVVAIQGDATAVDPGRRFGTLLSAGMLEFVPDAAAALGNAARCAEPLARFGVLFPTHNVPGRVYRWFHRRHGLAIRLFDRQSMGSLAEAAGWKIAQFKPAGPYSAVALLVRQAS